MAYQPYNPFDKIHLSESVARALLACPVVPLPPPEPFLGAGIYTLYYTGNFPAYHRIAEQNMHDTWAMPIYVTQVATY
jgi:Eco29kI restriction endonuclease